MSFPIAPSIRFPRRSILLAAMAAVSFLVLGCVFGGTGTDTENGVKENQDRNTGVMITGVTARVVDGEGNPIKGVALHLFQPEYRPDQKDLLANVLRDAGKALVSDSEGYVKLPLASFGKFVVEGVLAGQTLFYDTLAVPDTASATLYTFRTRALKGFNGKVRLVSGMRIDSGAVFIRGTGRFVKVDTAGNYDLGVLPVDVARMAIGMRYSSSPVSVKEATLVSRPDTSGPVLVNGNTKSVYTCKELPKDSADRISAPATIPRTDSADAESVKLDTGTVNPALKSCDSLHRGDVINVVRADSTKTGTIGDSTGTPVIILQNPTSASAMFGSKVVETMVVSYDACILSAGHEATSFDLQLQGTSVGSDILIKDVAEKCLAR